MERYIAFMLDNQEFKDSFQFMSSSLESLVSNLNKKDFKYIIELTKDEKQLELLTGKGVYSYDYVDSFERLNETQLPPKGAFYSQLNDEHISEEDYKHAQEVWNMFDIKNLVEFHNLYLKSDVLLLTDVFENFRKTCLHYRQIWLTACCLNLSLIHI